MKMSILLTLGFVMASTHANARPGNQRGDHLRQEIESCRTDSNPAVCTGQILLKKLERLEKKSRRHRRDYEPQGKFYHMKFYKSDSCSSNLLSQAFLQEVNSREAINNNQAECQKVVDEITSGGKNLWGVSVDGHCTDISDISSSSTQQIQAVCTDFENYTQN